jgi:amino acid adenylation domain-containing protein
VSERPDVSAPALKPQSFEAHAEQMPDAVAVVSENGSLTYGELDRRANQLAHYLRARSVGPEVPVAICMERSLELIVAMLGVLKSGGACVPMDPAYPQERLALMLEDTRPPVVLAQSTTRQRLPERYRSHTLCLNDSDCQLVARESTSRPDTGVTEGSCASVLYTSGSTGRPKGVMSTRGRSEGYQSWREEVYHLTRDDQHLLKASLGFTVALAEIFWALHTGGRLIVAPPGAAPQGDALVELIAEHGITILHLVPSQLRVLLEAQNLEACRTLRHVICTGESMPPDLPERLFDRLDVELTVLYGATEAPTATFRRCTRGDDWQIVSIGRPLPFRQVYVLDQALGPVPSGVAGELYIGGRLTRGYLGRPELTAERFIPDPFGDEPGARLYRTGDLVRQLPSGELQFLGRTDHQVQIRGVRVELAEIEARLREYPLVREVVVIAREEAAAEQRLVGYIVPAAPPDSQRGDEGGLSQRELRAFLSQRVPEYMIPGTFVLLHKLPLLPSGKIDRATLLAPEATCLKAVAYVAPRTPVEETLASIWAQLLGLERVGIDDDFFELGGHSLLATQLVSRVREAFQVELPLRSLFEEPTIAGLAEKIEVAQEANLALPIAILSTDSDNLEEERL